MVHSTATGKLPAKARAFRADWALLCLIALVSAALSVLQWRWTGELARAERVRLGAVLGEQTARLGQAFDELLRTNCSALLPAASELLGADVSRAYLDRYNEWRQQTGGEMFSRVAAAIPAKDGVDLFRFDGGSWRKQAWPVEWEYLRAAMARRAREEGPPPAVDATGDLVEMPVFAQSSEVAELAWVIYEVDRGYVQRKVLPSLVAELLNPAGEETFAAAVVDKNGVAVFGDARRTSDMRATLFPLNVGSPAGRGRGGRGRGGAGRSNGRWTLLTWHRGAGSLEDAVAHARRRNVSVSLVLIAVLGGAAWALVRYTARTRRLAEMQMEFVAGVSHDLRTPLAAIRGAAFNIRGGLVQKPESLDRYGQLILRNAEDLTGMIENLLAFAARKRISERGMASAEPVDAEAMIRSAVASMEHELESFGGEVRLELASGLPPVRGDGPALERAMRNLIDNAVRHGGAGKWVGVFARCDGDAVEIRVCDRGPGIAATDLPRIFEPFYRGEASRRMHVRGTGLGLGLVKETIDRHGGTVTARNGDEGGAEFVVRLPASPAEKA